MADVEVLDAAAAQRVREGLHSAAQTLTVTLSSLENAGHALSAMVETQRALAEVMEPIAAAFGGHEATQRR